MVQNCQGQRGPKNWGGVNEDRWQSLRAQQVGNNFAPQKTGYDQTRLSQLVQAECVNRPKAGYPRGIELAMGHQSSGGYLTPSSPQGRGPLLKAQQWMQPRSGGVAEATLGDGFLKM